MDLFKQREDLRVLSLNFQLHSFVICRSLGYNGVEYNL